MTAFWSLGGALLLAVALVDVFLTVLHYDGYGLLSEKLYRGMWKGLRRAVRRLPRQARAFALSLGAPLMIPSSLSLWISFVVLAFAFIYYAGFEGPANFPFAPGLQPTFLEALYLSGTSISTLGFGDVTAQTPLYEMLTVAEALIGFAILTLTISYVLNVYGVLQHQSTLGASLYHEAQGSDDYEMVLKLYLGDVSELDRFLQTLHRDLMEHFEGLRRYPIVYYFYSRQPHRSLPYIFAMSGALTAALRWGLPSDHPARSRPRLSTLTVAYTSISKHIAERFMNEALPTPPDPVDFQTFEACLEGNQQPSDELLGEFLKMQDRVLQLVESAPPDVDECYARYREWIGFGHHYCWFVRVSAEDLGYSN